MASRFKRAQSVLEYVLISALLTTAMVALVRWIDAKSQFFINQIGTGG